MTKNVADQSIERDPGLQEKVIGEMWDVDSYLYVVPDRGQPILSKIHIRTDEERDIAKRDRVDNRCEHINEILIGDFRDYAFEYFDSAFWKAADAPISYYYKDEVTGLGDPVAADSVPKGPLTRSQVMAFARDGRRDALVAAVWALMKQFDLPAAERKFIAIKDTEENVRKWIAAICYCFPRNIANNISFSTNLPKVGRDDNSTSYYVNKSTGSYVVGRDMQNPNQERRCYAMIVGVDPDGSCMDSNSMPGLPYVVIDGQRKEARFATDELVNLPYFRNIVNNDQSIENFGKYMNEMVDLPMGSALAHMFDAQCVLENEASWNYNSLIKSLTLLGPHFTDRSVLMLYVIDKLCNENKYINLFAQEDEQNGLKLFGILVELAKKLNNASIGDAFKRIAIGRLSYMLGNIQNPGLVTTYIQCLSQKNKALCSAALKEVVVNQRLSAIPLSSIPSASPQYINTVFDVIGECVASNMLGWTAFFQSNDFARVAKLLIERSVVDKNTVSNILRSLSSDSKAVDYYIKIGSDMPEDKISQCGWWYTLIANNVSIEHLCDIILEKRMSAKHIENILCYDIKIHGLSEQTYGLFKKYLGSASGVGENFYKECVKSAYNSQNRIQLLNRILSDIASSVNCSNILSEVLKLLDSYVQLNSSKENAELVELILDHQIKAPISALWQYLYGMSTAKLSPMNRDGIAGIYQKLNADGTQYYFSVNIMPEQLYQNFQRCIVDHAEEPAAHLIMLMSFEMPDPTVSMAQISQYAQELCKEIFKRRAGILAVIVNLYDCVSRGSYLNDPVDRLLVMFDKNELTNRLNTLLMAIQSELSTVRTDGIKERAVSQSAKRYDQQTVARVEQIFNNAQSIYQQNHKSVFGGLGGLFDLFKGKKN